MVPSLSAAARQFLVFVFIGMFALLSLLRLMEDGLIPWGSIMSIGVGAALLAGPVVWVMRDRYSEQSRERLTLVAFGVAMIVFPLTLGISLAFGVPPFIPPSDALIVGGYVGVLFALIVEHTIVPEGLRAVN